MLTWLRGFLYALGGLALIGVGHLSAKLVSTVANDSFFENLLSRLGKTLGIGALMIALVYLVVGIGLWTLRNWARVLTLILVTIWLLFGLLSLLRYPTIFHIVRVLIDIAILAYLMLPDVKKVFAAA